MNFYDSQKITTILESKGYQLQDSADNADLVVFNTCNIRDKAAHKVYSDIGRINKFGLLMYIASKIYFIISFSFSQNSS